MSKSFKVYLLKQKKEYCTEVGTYPSSLSAMKPFLFFSPCLKSALSCTLQINILPETYTYKHNN